MHECGAPTAPTYMYVYKLEDQLIHEITLLTTKQHQRPGGDWHRLSLVNFCSVYQCPIRTSVVH